MLRFTSCLFGTVVVHAYYRRLEVYHHLFLLVTILSILYHCTHQRHVARLDKGVAHAAHISEGSMSIHSDGHGGGSACPRVSSTVVDPISE